MRKSPFRKDDATKVLTRDQTRSIMNSVKRRDDTVNKLERLLKQQASDFAKQLS